MANGADDGRVLPTEASILKNWYRARGCALALGYGFRDWGDVRPCVGPWHEGMGRWHEGMGRWQTVWAIELGG
ncbi:Autoinducer 2 kinase LsrK [Gossypium arboreum]|uniref:Autoinducer 2 kinase LsrK n=1 Tax=Gossypium arboreum TaxID=29729 RepID=A0A0B0M727_GOSAR|nr:Autoinducer 2 kinase LsrK [Gossypium arboreum]